MRKLLSLLLISLTCSAFGQSPNIVTVFHKYYSTTFDKTKHIPIVVKYWLTRKMLECDTHIKRTNAFKPDPRIPDWTDLDKDYTKSGYDRGHNMPAEDNRCDPEGMKECFYYSNMFPQTHRLNAGAWKKLEEYERAEALQFDSVLVLCGSRAMLDTKIFRVTVPEYCWKVIIVKATMKVEAYSFKNDFTPSKPLESYKVSIDSVHRLSEIPFD
jgi:endonuclease G